MVYFVPQRIMECKRKIRLTAFRYCANLSLVTDERRTTDGHKGETMHKLTLDLIRACISMQVAALEWDNTDVSDHAGCEGANTALQTIANSIVKTVKQMKREL